MSRFRAAELKHAVKRMKSGKAVKSGDVPVECFKAMAAQDDDSFKILLDICNRSWEDKAIPEEWATASVALIFKKGDPAECENYRPICLLSVAYKLLASMIKQQFLDAGVDAALWPSQFGFRAARSTEDAIFIARRRIELARAQRHGKVSLLALDWRKAFDSINVNSLLDALRRFGIPAPFCEMLRGILQSRRFYVDECSETSGLRPQHSGISQGCTLSPMLFIIVMTVLLGDAVCCLGPEATAAYKAGDLADLV